MDRKILVALTAKKLWNAVMELTDDHEQKIKLVADADSETFRMYLIDVTAEACQLIKEYKGVK
ncbi:MAG: hypothetical protein HY433_00340 [Candidatus Liptonbacteria bacterium]|nr:hypothetical protein [Candidatus Liptonbacteria bacterium]